MPIELDVKITEKDMYHFHMYHMYHSFTGWFSVLISIMAFALAVLTWGKLELTYTILYTLFGVIFLFYFPLTLKTRAKRQIAQSEALKGTLHYKIDDAGVEVSFQEESALLEWKQIYKMVSTRQNVLIYSSRVNAYILPKEIIGGAYGNLTELAGKHLKKYQNGVK